MSNPLLISAAWQDLTSGKTSPINSSPVVLGDLFTIRIEGDKSRIAAMDMTIRRSDGTVVVHKLDTVYPWRAAPDSRGLSLPPGSYTFEAIPVVIDPTATVAPPLVVPFVIVADVKVRSAIPQAKEVVGKAPLESNGTLYGIVDASALRPETPISSALWSGTKTFLDLASAVGVGGVREWWSFTGQSSYDVTRAPKWDKIRPLTAAGMRVVLCCAAGASTWHRVGGKKPTARQTAESIAACIALIPSDIRPMLEIEVGNEMFLGGYWPGHDAKVFVDLMLGPCSKALRAAGLRVILGGLNGGSPGADLQKIIDAGGGGLFDAVGYHPYAENAAIYVAKTASLVTTAGAIPIVETESNTKDGPTYLAAKIAGGVSAAKCLTNVIANQDAIGAARLKFPTIEAVYQFSLRYQESSMTGPLGLLEVTYDAGGVARSARTTKLFEAKYAAKFLPT